MEYTLTREMLHSPNQLKKDFSSRNFMAAKSSCCVMLAQATSNMSSLDVLLKFVFAICCIRPILVIADD